MGAFKTAWANRPWRWLIGSVVVSMAGDFLYWVALVVFLLDGGGGAGWVSAALVARLVPYFLFGAVGGVIADRVDRRMLLIGLDLGRGAVFAALGILMLLDGPRGVAIALVAAASAIGAVYTPAMVATTPALVPEQDLAAANAAQAGLSQLSWFVGPALGAALVVVFDPGFVVLIDAVTFVISAALIARIGVITRADDETADDSDVRGGLRKGFSTVARDRGLISMTVVVVAALFAFGAEQVLYVLVAADRLGLGPEGIGILMAAMGIGGIVAAPFTARIAGSERLGHALVIAALLLPLPLFSMSFVRSPVLAVALAAVEGAAAIILEVGLLTLLQRAVAENSLGRVYAIQDTAGVTGELLGTAAAPALVAVIGLTAALRVVGSVSILVIVLAAAGVVGLTRSIESKRAALQELVRWYSELPSFEHFAVAGVERLARASTREVRPEGQVIIKAGSTSDALFVVESGRLAVTVPGRADLDIPALVEGDIFGEIGLLHRVDRTASVTAETDAEVLVIPGSVFLAVVSGGASLPGSIHRGVSERLARTGTV